MISPDPKAKWIVPPGLQQVVKRFNIKASAVAKSKTTLTQRHLLLHGPTGVGKSMFTDFFIRAYEKEFDQKASTTTVNCAAIPETLLESELFGYDKGAHSTATEAKPGYFEQAEDGILILEEIGEMPKYLQAKLLVAIEKKEFYRVGGVQPKKFKAHIVATTNVGRQQFREDFWFRFDSFRIPAIYERREDILYYIEKFNPTLLGQLKRSTVLSLLAYNWPGNVREIRRICHVIHEELQALEVEDLMMFNMANTQLGDYDTILSVDVSDSGIDFNKPRLLRRAFDKQISSKKLVKALTPFGIGFDFMNPVFSEKDRLSLRTNKGDRWCVFPMNHLFNLAYAGMLLFCKMFFKNIKGNYDLLDMNNHEFDDCSGYLVNELNDLYEPLKNLKFPQTPLSGRKQLQKIPQYVDNCMRLYTASLTELAESESKYAAITCQTLEFLTGIKGLSLNDLGDFIGFCRINSDNKFVSALQGLDVSAAKPKELTAESISMDELILLYYETVCSVVGTSYGFQKKLAAIAGRNEATVSQKLKKLGFKEKFEKTNSFPKKRLIFLDE